MGDLAITAEELALVVGMGSGGPSLGGGAAVTLAAPAMAPAARTVTPVAPAAAPAAHAMAPAAKAVTPAAKAVTAYPVNFAPLQPAKAVSSSSSPNLDMLMGVVLRVTVELGRTKMDIREILQLGPGSVVELDKLAGEPVDVLVNDRLIACGEVVVIDDRFGVRITDVPSAVQRVSTLKGR